MIFRKVSGQDENRKQRMAVGALSHLIGAYYLLGGLICDCDPQRDRNLKQILLHAKGIYWGIMFMRFGIANPKSQDRDDPLETKEL